MVPDKVPRYSNPQQYPPPLQDSEIPKSDLIITKYKANRITGMHKSQKDRKRTVVAPKQSPMLGSVYRPTPATVATVAAEGLYKRLPSQNGR